ncbi:hypothetical protein ACFXOM_34915 [Streptomyces sp. NPDC059169]|uniref:hypothetical protein n=1 Tax=Streptomyces sp. NPDC059169 TaxID=3346754 RepID=UPI003682936F
MIADALRSQGIVKDHYALRSRGDGGRYDFVPGISPVPVVEALTERLPSLLRRHNKQSSEALQLGLRLVVHGGYQIPTEDGDDADGAAVNLLHGMLDSGELREALAEGEAPYVLAVSEDIWNGAVRHGHGDLDPDAFGPTELTVKGGARVAAWLCPELRHPRESQPAQETKSVQPSRRDADDGAPRRADDRSVGGGITFNGAVKAKNVVNGPQWNIR